jgi:hypothetical protein
MYDYAEEIREDVRHYHGERFAPKNPPKDYKEEIAEAIAITNAMTNDERNAIHYLAEYNREELSRLYKRVKERMANNG